MDGICARSSMHLRPFGNAGRLALSFAAMEQYYQSEGRDWERYASIKARPVAGDRADGKQLQELLRPFVYRKYLDYTAFAGLMKALIDAEVARKDLADNLKLGPGGIREIEFIVQLVQLIRGGQRTEPARARAAAGAGRLRGARTHRRTARAAAARGLCLAAPGGKPRADAARCADPRHPRRRAEPRTHRAQPRLRRLGHARCGAGGASRDRQRGVCRRADAQEHGRVAAAPVADVRLWERACDETLDAATLEASGCVPAARWPTPC
ncbi:Bifunctional glutamine synthetase adenylyltransferase/adenylyl-removing enzyme [Streptomyces alboniger]